jgi:hypothetical protein
MAMKAKYCCGSIPEEKKGGRREEEGGGRREEEEGGREEGGHTRGIKLYGQLDLINFVDNGNEGQVLRSIEFNWEGIPKGMRGEGREEEEGGGKRRKEGRGGKRRREEGGIPEV